MTKKIISINRAPVLTLWASIVAERLGYDHSTALTLGKAVAGLNAQAKGQRLGIFEKPERKPLTVRRKSEVPRKNIIALMGRLIPVVNLRDGDRAVVKDEAIDPMSVEKYLIQKFGDNLTEVQDAMRGLSKAHKPAELASMAYRLYEKFRPTVPEGEKGWGAKGVLDLDYIRSLVK